MTDATGSLHPPRGRDNPLTRSVAGMIGIGFLAAMFVACLATLPWTLGALSADDPTPLYNAGEARDGLLGPWWIPADEFDRQKLNARVPDEAVEPIAQAAGMSIDEARRQTAGEVARQLAGTWDRGTLFWLFGTDALGRSLFVRCLTGGGISLTIGISAALISVCIGTVYGSVAAYAGGRVDSVMMRIVDVLYGLPYILLVVLLAVAGDAMLEEYVSRSRAREAWVQDATERLFLATGVQSETAQSAELAASPEPSTALVLLAEPILEKGESETRVWLAERRTLEDVIRDLANLRLPERQISASRRTKYDIIVLLIAISGVSWLTMARVIRGQVLSLKAQPFIEAARAVGVPLPRLFLRHLLPNLIGPIVVYATLTVPQAILQESFLSFLGIGVKPPLPSWGNLAADGLAQLNTFKSRWWLLVFPCLLLGTTLLAMNFVGEGLREAFDPKRAKR